MTSALPADAQAPALGDVPGEFLFAKLRGRRSLLLEGDRLRELAREPSLPDLALRLYPHERVAGRSDLERVILRGCVAELNGLARYAGGPRGVLYRRLLDRYRVENLKVLLRLHGSKEDPSPYLIDLPDNRALPVDVLRAAPTVGAFVDAIPLPFVRSGAREAMDAHEATRNRAYLEMAFDRGYWEGVRDAIGRLPAAEARRCAGPIRAEREAMRLLATLRASAVYALSWEEWSPYLPPAAGGAPDEMLQAVHARPDIDRLVDTVPFLRRVPGVGAAADIGELEEVLWQRTVHAADRQFYSTSSAGALLVSYFYLKRNETRRLLELAQRLHHGRTPEETAERPNPG